MMRSLFKKRVPAKKDETWCIATIDSDTASAAVVRTFADRDATGRPVLLAVANRPVTGDTLSSAATALREALEKARSAGGNPSRIMCVIGEPWVSTYPRRITIEKNEPFRATEKMILESIKKDDAAFECDMIRDIPDVELSRLEPGRVSYQSNGYRISNLGKDPVPNLDIMRSVSVIRTDVLEEIAGVIADVFHRTDAVFLSHHDVLAQAAPLEKIIHAAVGGVSTDMIVADRGVMLGQQPISTGLAHMRSMIQHEFSIPASMIDSTMSFSSDAGMVEHARDLYYSRNARVISEWVREMRRAYEQIGRAVDRLPSTIVISGNAPWLGILAPVMARELGMGIAVLCEPATDSVMVAHGAKTAPLGLLHAVDYVANSYPLWNHDAKK